MHLIELEYWRFINRCIYYTNARTVMSFEDFIDMDIRLSD